MTPDIARPGSAARRFRAGTSGGAVVDLGPGDAVLMEDTTGKGRSARTLDGTEVHALMVHLD